MTTTHSHSSIRQLITPLLHSFRSSLSLTHHASPSLLPTLTSTSRPFSSTPTRQKDDQRRKIDPRITLIRYHMQHPTTPRPLRFSRTRALRHWTIHRAWMLARREKSAREERELQRMYQSIHSACEVLRTMDESDGEKGRDSGRLYRIAMEKRGVFGPGGVPIEYARLQTESPGRVAWDHGWTR